MGHQGGANFYYGAPAPYAESIAPSHHSTYAHYYDDEEDGWDMPNFYNEGYMKVRHLGFVSNNNSIFSLSLSLGRSGWEDEQFGQIQRQSLWQQGGALRQAQKTRIPGRQER